MNGRRVIMGLGAVAALVLHLAATIRPVAPAVGGSGPLFDVPAVQPVRSGESGPVYRTERFATGADVASVHVASLCEYAPGRLAAAWYGGSREGARNVAVFVSRREAPGAAWTEPAMVVTPASAQRELGVFVRKVGNALVFADGQGGVGLLYVSIAIGGWAGSSLNLKHSADGGVSWTQSERLRLSPFLNISELVKNKPVDLEGGGRVVPIYHEMAAKYPELLWLDGSGSARSAERTRPFGGATAFQPALVALDGRRAVLLCRTASRRREIFASRTVDGGRRWTAPEPAGLPNPDAGIDATRLADGRLLLAFNDSVADRGNLRLALSTDEGRTWRRAATVADEPGAEFSYPFLIQTGDGRVHLVYTWKRRAIEHVEFNLEWLDAQGAGGAR